MRKQFRYKDAYVLINGTPLRQSQLTRGRGYALRGDVYFALGLLDCESPYSRVDIVKELEAMGYNVYGKVYEEGNVLRLNIQPKVLSVPE